MKRLNVARWKKKKLLKKIQQKEIPKKSIEWIERKKEIWRKIREEVNLGDEDIEEIKNKLIERVPIRKAKETNDDTSNDDVDDRKSVDMVDSRPR